MILYNTILFTAFFSCALNTSQEDISTAQQIPSLQQLCLESQSNFSEGKSLGDWYAGEIHKSIYDDTRNINPLQEPGQTESPSLSHVFLPYLRKIDKGDLHLEDYPAWDIHSYSLYELAVQKNSRIAINFLLDAGIDINDLRDDVLLNHIEQLNLTTEQIKEYIAKGAATTGTNRSEHTPLHNAATYPDAIELLLQHGAQKNINAQDGNGQTPLHKAASTARSIALLASSGACINIKDFQNNTPLHQSCNPDALEMLIAMGADIHAQNNFGATALHNAVSRLLSPMYSRDYRPDDSAKDQSDSVLIIEKLIARGINTQLKDKKNTTAFDKFKALTTRSRQFPMGEAEEKVLKQAQEFKATVETALQKQRKTELARELAEYFLTKNK